MTVEMTELALAKQRAAAARARLSDTVGELQARLDPKSLAREAAETLADGSGRALRVGLDTARAHPGKIAGAVALVAAVAGRKQIAALFDRLRRKDATTAAGARSKLKRMAPPRKRTN